MTDEHRSEHPLTQVPPRSAPAIHVAALDQLTPRQLYGILRLRVQVFTVEQRCAYQDLDGKDLDPQTRLLWLEDGGQVVSSLRVLHRGERRVIGRVVTAQGYRGCGRSGQLMHRAIDLCDGRAIDLSAQAHLQAWYERFGFVRLGDTYLEDGIPHVAMCRPATR